jgi:hypothetical protein
MFTLIKGMTILTECLWHEKHKLLLIETSDKNEIFDHVTKHNLIKKYRKN